MNERLRGLLGWVESPIHPPAADEDIQLIGFASMQVKRKFLAETVNLPETKSGNV